VHHNNLRIPKLKLKNTIKEYGPLYCIPTIFPYYLNHSFKSYFVAFLPYPLTYISGFLFLDDIVYEWLIIIINIINENGD
jgi:hypothetical protein